MDRLVLVGWCRWRWRCWGPVCRWGWSAAYVVVTLLAIGFLALAVATLVLGLASS